jgi:DOPA 4,5-dioxygenase
MTGISEFHAHVYFDADTVEQARALCEAARDRFGVAMGRMHERPVGPHPMWSCQLSLAPESFGAVIPWLALNRDGLVVFVHPNTGDDIPDHTDRAMWMGAVMALNLDALR